MLHLGEVLIQSSNLLVVIVVFVNWQYYQVKSIPLGTYDYTHMNHSEPPRVRLCCSHYAVKGKESNPFPLNDPVVHVGVCSRISFQGIFEVVENLSYLAKSLHSQDWFCSMNFLVTWSQEGEKCGFILAWAECNMQPSSVGWHCAFKQTIICRQLFGDYVVSFQPMKKKIFIKWCYTFSEHCWGYEIEEYFRHGEVSNYILSWFVYLLLQIASICHVLSNMSIIS